MNQKTTVFSAVLLTLMFGFTLAEAQTMKNEGLNAKQQSIVAIAAFTARGEVEKLKPALNEGLDAGLTVNEIKEMLVQLYAYAGFPRSLNGLIAFMAVLDERQKNGLKDEMGREAGPLPAGMNRNEYGAKVRARLGGSEVIAPPSGYQLFAPVIDAFLKEHLFADIFARDNLDYQSRELTTISALAGMEGVNPQLQGHFNFGFNTGLTEAQMRSLIAVLEARVGKKEADNAAEVLGRVSAGRAKK